MIVNLVAADLFKWLSFGPCVIRRFHGWNNQASAIYIQFHQRPPLGTAAPFTIIPNGTVPACKSFLAQANNGFDYAHEDLPLTECTVCLSSTETSLTAVGAGAGLDWSIEIDTVCPVTGREDGRVVKIVGDLTTGADALTVWTDVVANSKNRLLRLTYINNDNLGQDYLLLFADTAGTNPSPLLASLVTAGNTLDLFFGPTGRQVYINDESLKADASHGTGEHWGCAIEQSATALATGVTATALSNMRAIYLV